MGQNCCYNPPADAKVHPGDDATQDAEELAVDDGDDTEKLVKSDDTDAVKSVKARQPENSESNEMMGSNGLVKQLSKGMDWATMEQSKSLPVEHGADSERTKAMIIDARDRVRAQLRADAEATRALMRSAHDKTREIEQADAEKLKAQETEDAVLNAIDVETKNTDTEGSAASVLRKIFEGMDQDSDGKVDIKELNQSLRVSKELQELFDVDISSGGKGAGKGSGPPPLPSFFTQQITKLDLDGDGKVSFAEFETHFFCKIDGRANSIDAWASLFRMFNLIDADHSGKIEINELNKALRENVQVREALGFDYKQSGGKGNGKGSAPPLPQVFVDMISKFDQDGDGKISWKEFSEHLQAAPATNGQRNEGGKAQPTDAPAATTATPLQLQVQIPAGAVAGTMIQVQAPDGRVVQVSVPAGAAPGSTITVQI